MVMTSDIESTGLWASPLRYGTYQYLIKPLCKTFSTVISIRIRLFDTCVIIFPSLLVASQISRSNHSMV